MALTTPPDFTNGVLTAAKLQQLSDAISDRTPLYARKTADETVNNSATMQNDDELVLPMAANTLYQLDLHLKQTSGVTPGFKVTFLLPSGATWLQGSFDCGSSPANEQFGASVGVVTGITGLGADSLLIMRSLILTSTTTGSVNFQWAQNTANASDTIVRAGSWLRLTRLA